MSKNQSSKFRGVTWSRRHKRWQAGISLQGKFLYLGTYEDEADAARIWDLAALKSRGISAHTNFELGNYLNPSGQIIAVERLDAAVSRHQAKRNLQPAASPAEKALAVFLGPAAAAAAAAAAAGGDDDEDGDDSDWAPDRPLKQQRRTRGVRRKGMPAAVPARSSNSMSSSSSSGSGSNSSSNPALLPAGPAQEEAADTSSAAEAAAAAAAAAGDAAQSEHTGARAYALAPTAAAAGGAGADSLVTDNSSMAHYTLHIVKQEPSALPPAGFERPCTNSSSSSSV
ncbi:hypothetical protein OEZ85_003120 [Tetradesmus obliquus]|uniref:AP2/ERF domain-containing protein n=1 Tax=Tetradesmus obliquus TaxID=3088 RepID=A0ABY8U4M7_TETOB|nr:hypothetical protein OEZ85_003120 [Tetradesmus obliquus]